MRALALLLLLAAPLAAQEPPETVAGTGALLRALDKISGETTDLTLAPGQETTFGWLALRLGDCRMPADDPDSDAFAWLEMADTRSGTEVFRGWMIASSPGLNALDHPRYDIWVMRCTRS